MKKFLENDIKILSIPAAVIAGVLILTLISGKIILDNIGRLNQEVSDNKKSEEMLQTKLNSLQTINQQISTESIAVTNALPGKSSVLATISELQLQSISLNLSLENIKSTAISMKSVNTNLVSTEIDFDADGSYQSISTFIKFLKSFVPITRLDSIKIISQNSSTTNNLYRLSANLFTYWAPLPTKIPSISEPLVELTADEQKILTQVSNLPQPISVSSGNSSPVASGSGVTVGRSDPFGN